MTSLPIAFTAFGSEYPRNPARFARRIASFSYSLGCFLPQIPKFPRHASRARWLHSLFLFAALTPNTPKIPRRASRAGLLHLPMAFAAFRPQIPPRFSRRASRARLLHSLMFLLLIHPKYPKNPARVLHFPIGSVAFYSKIPLRNPGALRPPAGSQPYPFWERTSPAV